MQRKLNKNLEWSKTEGNQHVDEWRMKNTIQFSTQVHGHVRNNDEEAITFNKKHACIHTHIQTK